MARNVPEANGIGFRLTFVSRLPTSHELLEQRFLQHRRLGSRSRVLEAAQRGGVRSITVLLGCRLKRWIAPQRAVVVRVLVV